MEANSVNFEELVVKASFENYVLVDFWAGWCAPCRALKPILERLTKEYEGLILVKINTEECPDIAQRFGVRSIPDVRLFKDGAVVDSFVGALPEPKIREFLEKYVKNRAMLNLDRLKAAILRADEDEIKEVANSLKDAIGFREVAIRRLMEANFYELAKEIADVSKEQDDDFSKIAPLKSVIELTRFTNEEADESDVSKLFLQGCKELQNRDFKAALDSFLEVVKKDRAYKDDGARKAMVAIFGMLGNSDPLTIEYRSKLSSVIF